MNKEDFDAQLKCNTARINSVEESVFTHTIALWIVFIVLFVLIVIFNGKVCKIKDELKSQKESIEANEQIIRNLEYDMVDLECAKYFILTESETDTSIRVEAVRDIVAEVNHRYQLRAERRKLLNKKREALK